MMFTVVTNRPKRRVWTPRTVAASIGAHVVMLGIFVTAAESRTPRRDPPPPEPWIYCLDCVRPPAPPSVAPPSSAPGRPAGKDGDPGLLPPRGASDSLPAATGDTATRHHAGFGAVGGGGGTAVTPTHPPGGGSGTGWETYRCDSLCIPDEVSVLPQLANEREAQRMLQRVYPPALRDSKITGTTTVELIIDRQGNVEPGSVSILDSTHPAFEDAARRAVEKFRFTPAQVDGRSVAVIIALPIRWSLQN
ncbi:MAG TPA: energy transducer TonB [Longimicrobium sp.]